MQKAIQLFVLGVLVGIANASIAQTAWKIDKDENGIKVYTRIEEDSDFKAFKAITQLEASLQEIIAILQDADNYVDWYGFTKSSQLVKREKNVQYNYVETIFPWPFKNRDMTYRMSIDTTSSMETRISLTGLPDYLPEIKGIVRMKKAEGYILLRPMDGSTEIEYVFHSDPGENVPVWLANQSIAELPFRTLMGLRERVEQ